MGGTMLFIQLHYKNKYEYLTISTINVECRSAYVKNVYYDAIRN